MGSATNDTRIVRFGPFELDLDARDLRKLGVRIRLQEQPFQILAMLLESPGSVVTREELRKRLWTDDTFVDFDLSLNSAVRKLRCALGDESATPRFIETLYRRGYRFIGNASALVTVPEGAPARSSVAQLPVEHSSKPVSMPKTSPHALAWAIAAMLILITVIATLMWFNRRSPLIVGYTQITHDGLRKGSIVTDGQRLYFAELKGEHFVPAQVSMLGGETSLLDSPFPEAYPPDIAADGSALLIVAFSGTAEGPLFSFPLPTGSPQRLNNAIGHSATWSLDGQRLFFATGPDIYAASGNGSKPRKLVTVDGAASDLRVSPDGSRLRFSVVTPNSDFSSLWELNADGRNLHPLLPGWNATPRECCGNWTPDGKYYIFQSLRDGKVNLWLLPYQTNLLHRNVEPIQLTNGPLDFSSPLVSKDGKKLFAVGSQVRTELVRYNGGSEFVPYLGGISATDLSFSPDGKSIAYVSVPDGALWRSSIDGTERLLLTEPSLRAALPRWSPDGKQIVFVGQTSNTNWRAYIISSDGGVPRDLVPSAHAGFDPGWSPDGRSVVLTLNGSSSLGISPSGPGIAIVDAKTGKVSLLPGAAQLFSPRWSPDGKYIAALTGDSQKLLLFDFATGRWTDLVTMPMGYPVWSHNGKYLYFESASEEDPTLFRVRISDHKVERVASLKGLRRFWGQFGSWTGLAPDDSPLLVRDTSSQEIYALDWEAR